MKSYILVLMIFSIISLIIKERKRLMFSVNLLLKIDVKKLVYSIGSIYLVVSFLLLLYSSAYICTYLIIPFLLGVVYILYASSKHFDKINIIRKIKELVEKTEVYKTSKSYLLCDIEIKCNIDTPKPMIKIQELSDDKGNIVFKLIDSKFIREYIEHWAESNIEKDSIMDFLTLFEGGLISNRICLKSTAQKSKDITYRPLFEFLNKITYLGIKELVLLHRNQLIDFICKNFTKGEKEITKEMLNPRFSTWRKHLNIGEKHLYANIWHFSPIDNNIF